MDEGGHGTLRHTMKPRRVSVQFRAAPDEGEGVLVGYATLFDSPYKVGRNEYESISRGAFDETLRDQGAVIPIFWEHTWNSSKGTPQPPIGVATAESDEHGLKVKAQLFHDDLPAAKSVWLAARAGGLREWSIGYVPQDVHQDTEMKNLEHVDACELLEASVVVRGAANTEMVAVRAATIEDVRASAAEEVVEETVEEVAEMPLDEAWQLLSNPHVREALSVMVQWDTETIETTEEQTA